MVRDTLVEWEHVSITALCGSLIYRPCELISANYLYLDQLIVSKMENSPSSSLSSDLSRLKTRDEVIRFISSSLSSIDADCALHNSPLKIDESIDLLLRIDATVATMTAELDVQILQQTWRRLIAFFKSYHMFITSAQVDRVSKVLNIRACYFVNVLCIEGAAEKSCTFSREKQQQNYTSMVLNLQSLSFYCQRISASMAYFSMQYDEDSYQISMEILFFFRGYLSYFPSNPAIITRSEEFFWKALRSPFTATHDMTNALYEESKNSIEKSSSSGKRKRDISITDGDIKSYPCNTSSSASSPFKKFDRAVRNLGRLCCSTLHPECKEGNIRDITGYCLSLGCSYLASYELEKRTKEHSDSSSDPTRRPSDASDVIDEMQRGHDHSQAVLILLNVFVSAIQKIVISYNCVGSDLAVTAASKHFQNTFLCCLTSINELVKIEVTGTGTGAGARVGTGAGAGTGTGTGSSYVNVIIVSVRSRWMSMSMSMLRSLCSSKPNHPFMCHSSFKSIRASPLIELFLTAYIIVPRGES